jgi:hypothetical protein
MPYIPRQIKPPARVAVTCKVPEAIFALLKCYAEFLDSSQEHVVTEVLRLTFRRDREFHAWLTTTHPDLRQAAMGAPVTSDEQAGSTAAAAADRSASVGSPRPQTRSKSASGVEDA